MLEQKLRVKSVNRVKIEHVQVELRLLKYKKMRKKLFLKNNKKCQH